jgi:hypothetical protein
MKLARASLTLLAIQLGLVSSIAAKYLIDRKTNPRVWTRAVAYDPQMIMRGRYLSIQLRIDACGVNLPLAHDQSMASEGDRAYFDPDENGTVTAQLPIIAGVKNNKLVVLRIAKSRDENKSQEITLRKGGTCNDAVLWTPVNFYLSETAKSPFPLQKGQELWVDVTVPSAGPPRPISLAIKSAEGQWQPLSYR